MLQARLILEDGTIFVGTSFGSQAESFGEVVFHTGMTGYQGILSDPSYCGHIVTMTYPLIGISGVTRDDFESVRPHVGGFVVRRYEDVPSNWRAQYTLDDMMKEYDIPGISEIDTRMLTRKLRSQGTMKGIITTSSVSEQELLERMKATLLLRDQVSRVSTKQMYSAPGFKERIVLIDFGSKSSIVRELVVRGCDVIVVPYDTAAEQIRRLRPDGILLSSGPGNPKDVPDAIRTISELVQEYPMFGICLGHQLFALACGADTEKMKYGHRGDNHPVKDLKTGRCYITSQNHGHTVLEHSVAGTKLSITHINNNDKSIEGLRHTEFPAFSVQYQPETGPYDSSYLFDEFLDMIRKHKADQPAMPSQAKFIAARGGAAQYAEK